MKSLRAAALAALLATGMVVAACGSSSSPLDTSTEQSTAGGDAGFQPDTTAPASDADQGTTSDQQSTESSDEAASTPIVIGSGNFTESELLAGIYAAALKAKGVTVSTKLDIGAREIYLDAMKDGSINLFPEYTGGLLAYFDPKSTATAADDVYADLQKALPDSMKVLDMSKAQDQDSITVTKATAEKYDLESIGDLAPVAKDMTLGGSSELKTRADGPKGLKKIYGVVFGHYKELDSGGPLSVKGLTTGLVQAADIFTTNPAIEENDFVVLKDPKSLFQAQNVVPLISASAASPTVTDTLNAVSAKLTTEALTDMLKTINDDKSDPAEVGADWVSKNDLG